MMLSLTVLLAILLLVAWKKPEWIKYFGAISLTAVAIYLLIRVSGTGLAIMKTGKIPNATIIGAALHHWSIPLVYALLIYLLSLLLRMLRKQ